LLTVKTLRDGDEVPPLEEKNIDLTGRFRGVTISLKSIRYCEPFFPGTGRQDGVVKQSPA